MGILTVNRPPGARSCCLAFVAIGAGRLMTRRTVHRQNTKRHTKAFHSYVRCASLPDPIKMEDERLEVERAWPAYAQDQSLCRLPAEFWKMGREETVTHPWEDQNTTAAWQADGEKWKGLYEDRVQHTFTRMNHHIHPLNEATGERRVLKSCRAKNNKSEICKYGCPWESEMTNKPLLVCRCIAKERDLPHKGARSTLGGVLSERNWSHQNAGPRLNVAVMGDNGDIKAIQKYPILESTHEAVEDPEQRQKCLSARSNKDMSD